MITATGWPRKNGSHCIAWRVNTYWPSRTRSSKRC